MMRPQTTTTWPALCLLLLWSTNSVALTPVTMCIWDPVGTQGPVFSFFFDLEVKALAWDTDLEMRAYESEVEALELLENGDCDLSVVTAILARNYVPFGGSLDAIGSVRTEEQLSMLLASLNSPKMTDALRQGHYEIAAVLPVGPMYAFVNDRRITDIGAFRHKRISALNADVQTHKLAEVKGAQAIDTTISNFADLFKSRQLDIVLMPALAYNAFELQQALRHQGGVIDIPFFNGMLQAVAHRDKVSNEFSRKLRQYMTQRITAIFKLIETAESEIPEHYWIQTDQRLKTELEWLFKDIRLELMFENKLDARALKLLWKIRCKTHAEHPECGT